MQNFIKSMFTKILLKWIVLALIVFAVTKFIPGLSVDDFTALVLTSGAIALINIFIKPILKVITLPINMMSMGLFTVVLNAFLLIVVAYYIPGFHIDNFLSACTGSISISVLSIVLNFI